MLISKRDQTRIMRMLKAATVVGEDTLDRKAAATALRAAANRLEAKALTGAEYLDDLYEEELDDDLLLEEEEDEEQEHT